MTNYVNLLETIDALGVVVHDAHKLIEQHGHRWYEQRMIKKQAELISKLNDTRREIIQENDRIALNNEQLAADNRLLKQRAQIYEDLQTLAAYYPTIHYEWKRFCMFLRMAVPDENIHKAAQHIRDGNDPMTLNEIDSEDLIYDDED